MEATEIKFYVSTAVVTKILSKLEKKKKKPVGFK